MYKVGGRVKENREGWWRSWIRQLQESFSHVFVGKGQRKQNENWAEAVCMRGFSTLCSPRTCPLGSEATTDLGLAGRSQEDKYLSLSLLLSVHLLLVAPIGRNQPKARWQGSLFAVDHIAHLSERREGWKKERICRGTWSLQHRPPMS